MLDILISINCLFPRPQTAQNIQEVHMIYYYKQSFEKAFKSKDFYEDDYFDMFVGDELTSENSIHTALMVNKYFSNEEKSEKSNNQFWYNIGYKAFGVLLWDFTKWIIKKSTQDQVEKI